MIILKCSHKTEYNGVDYFHLTVDRDQWRSLVNNVMNLLAS
jgi:hypothetical protein